MATAFDRLLDLVRALNANGVEYVLFGGQAVNLHGIPRFTEDIDVFIRPDEANVDRLRQALRNLWDDPSIAEIDAADLSGDYAVVRYGTPDDFVIDLVSRIDEAWRYDQIESEIVNVDGVPVRVATPSMLYRMKKGTVRPVDQGDAADLRAKFDLEDD